MVGFSEDSVRGDKNHGEGFHAIQTPHSIVIRLNKENGAKKTGYVETFMGRNRRLKDIHSENFTVKGFAERNAINPPIQGTPADMIMLAMIKVAAALKANNFKSKMLSQVHDELVF